MENNFKRFLSLLLAFVMVLGMFPMTHAHAEEETYIAIGEKVTSVEANATYVICLHGTMNAMSNQQGSGAWGTHTLATGACDKLADARILWTLEPAEGGYKLKNASGYLNISRNSASLNETGHVFDLVNNGAEGWAITSLDTNEYGNNLGDSGCIGGWSGCFAVRGEHGLRQNPSMLFSALPSAPQGLRAGGKLPEVKKSESKF